MKKNIKDIRIIFQATKDGDTPEIFHAKCDNINNTLVLYKSEGNRRFGGFASECIKSDRNPIIDKNCFLFSYYSAFLLAESCIHLNSIPLLHDSREKKTGSRPPYILQ